MDDVKNIEVVEGVINTVDRLVLSDVMNKAANFDGQLIDSLNAPDSGYALWTAFRPLVKSYGDLVTTVNRMNYKLSEVLKTMKK